MALWLAWLLVAVALGVAEAFTLTAVLGLLGGAALLTAGVAAIGAPALLQLLVFALTSVIPGEVTAALQGVSRAFTETIPATADRAAPAGNGAPPRPPSR